MACSFGAHPASASQIVLTFAGTIDHSQNNISTISLLGEPFSGELSYDSDDPILFSVPGSPSTPAVTRYSFGPSDFLTLTIGTYTFSASGNAVGTNNALDVIYHQSWSGGPSVDLFSMGAVLGSNISSNFPGFVPYALDFEIAGPAGLLTSPGLPTSFDFSKVVSPAFGGFTTGAGVDSFPDANFANTAFEGTSFTSLQIQAAPEAGTGSLLAAGLLGLVLTPKVRRIKKTHP